MNYLEKIKGFYRKHRRMPSYGEIRTLLRFKSKTAGVKIAKKLIDEDYLQKDTTGKLLPGPLFFDIRILGSVEAGFPSPAEEELTDTMTLDDFLIQNKEATYMLTVKGDSMKDAGIINGDMVLVERGTDAKDGTIVVAHIDGEWTIKYLRKNGSRVWLEPANSNYKKLYPKESLTIAATVKAVIRKY
jgi:SOS regulatory protein LexA